MNMSNGKKQSAMNTVRVRDGSYVAYISNSSASGVVHLFHGRLLLGAGEGRRYVAVRIAAEPVNHSIEQVIRLVAIALG